MSRIIRLLKNRRLRTTARRCAAIVLAWTTFMFVFPVEACAMPNIQMPTLGGKQVWSDEKVMSGWRIQRNVLTGHWRLLDPRDTRHAWGSFEHCEDKLAGMQARGKVAAPAKDVVVILHGMWRAKESMAPVAEALKEEGYGVVNINYPSYFRTIEAHAAQLDRVMAALPDAENIYFVTHSTGGIVVRCWLRDHPDARVRRIVLIAAPNQGTGLADILDDAGVLRPFFGPAAMQMRTAGHGGMTAAFGVPDCDIGIVAGGTGSRGYNPLLDGDNDFVVEVENTRLAGMDDFYRVRSIHTYTMSKPGVLEAIACFLETGRFTAP